MPFVRPAALSVAGLLALAGPAAAQAPLQAPISQLERLADVLGGLHGLRILCEGDREQTWRENMGSVLEMEAPRDGPRRQRLIAAFNRGYYRENDRHADCTRAVRAEEARLAAEGRRLARDLSRRYLE